MEGLFYDDIRDFQKAEPVYRAWAARYPNDYVPLFYRGSMLSCLGRNEEAIRTWEKSFDLKRYPTTAEELGKLALLAGDVRKAENWLAKLRDLGSPRPQTALGAKLLICRGDYAAALKTLEKWRLLKDSRSKASVAQLQASLYADLDRPEEAIRILRDAIAFERGEGEPQFIEDLSLALAAVLAQSKRLREAIDFADSCLRPGLSPGAIEKLARVYRVAGMPQRIQALLKRIPEHSGFPVFDHARAIVAGEAAFAAKEFATARRQFEMASSTIPAGYLSPMALWELLAAAQWRDEAVRGLREPSLNPAYLWRNMERLWPGVWRHALSLFTTVGPNRSDLINARNRLDALNL